MFSSPGDFYIFIKINGVKCSAAAVFVREGASGSLLGKYTPGSPGTYEVLYNASSAGYTIHDYSVDAAGNVIFTGETAMTAEKIVGKIPAGGAVSIEIAANPPIEKTERLEDIE